MPALYFIPALVAGMLALMLWADRDICGQMHPHPHFVSGKCPYEK